MEVPTKKFLSFDGTNLGDFDFWTVISWTYPCSKLTLRGKTVALYAIMNLPGIEGPQYVILKRNRTKSTDQLIVDELKPIFGLKKMGTHTIRLRGIAKKYDKNFPWIVDMPNGQTNTNVQIDPKWSDYFVFHATVNKNTSVEGQMMFMALPSLKEQDPYPLVQSELKEGHKKFYYEVQKILIFRELMRIADTNLGDILIKNLLPLSIDEMVIKTADFKKLPEEIEKFYFIKLTSKTEVIIRMLGLNRQNYQDKLEILRNSMIQVISRLDDVKMWLVDDVINQLIDRCAIHYKLIEDL
jgi:hypothetical protein